MSGLGFLFIVLTLAGMLCAFTLSCRPAHGGPPTVSAHSITGLSKDRIGRLLDQLVKNEAPEHVMGAMCYKPASLPQRAEYVCPACGERTVYTNDVAREITSVESARRIFPELGKVSDGSILLDESQFCRSCSPAVTNPALSLTVRYEDGREVLTAPVTMHDIRILTDFLDGKLSFRTFNDGSSALKQYEPRLRQLLGAGGEE